MDEPTTKPSGTSPLHSLEGGLFDALFGFHKKFMDLLRAANLNDDQVALAVERFKLLTDKMLEDVQRTHDLNIQPRLDSMYEELKRLVNELSSTSAE